MADRIRIEITGDSADLRHAVALAEHSLRDLGREVRRQNAEQRAFAGGSNDVVRALDRVERQVRKTDSSHQRLGRTMATVGWSSLAIGIGPAVSALTSATAGAVALTSALGPLVGALAAAPAAFSAVAQAAGVGFLAFHGVIDALKATSQAHMTAGTDAVANANRQRDAAARVVAAKEQIRVANQTERDAELQLHDARRQAIRDLQDLENQAKDSALAEQRANLTLKDALRRLREAELSPTATSRDLTDARLTVQEARRALAEAKQTHARQAADASKARRGGIEGMPQVVQAHKQVADAQRAQADAARQLSAAQLDAADAMAHQSAAATDLHQKLADLSPAARAFVREIQSLKPAFKDLQHVAQEGLFPGLTHGIQQATQNLPVLRDLVGRTAKEMGSLADKAGTALGSKRWGADIEKLGRANVHLLHDAGVSAGNLASALTHVSVAAIPLTRWMADSFTAWTRQIDQWAQAKRASGELNRFFAETRRVLTQVVDIGKNAAETLFHIGQAALPLGREALTGLDHLFRRLNDWSKSTQGKQQLADFFTAAREPLRAVARLAGDLLVDLLKLGQLGAPALAEVARILDKDLLPPLNDLARAITKDLLPHLLGAVKALAGLFKAVEPGIKALIPPLNVVLDVLKGVLGFVTDLTDALPGVLKLAPALLVGAAVLKSWRELRALVAGTAALSTLGGGGRLPAPTPGSRVPGLPAPGGAGGGRVVRGVAAFGALGRAAAPIIVINTALSTPALLNELAGGRNAQQMVQRFASNATFGLVSSRVGLSQALQPSVLNPTGGLNITDTRNQSQKAADNFKAMHDWIVKAKPPLDSLNKALADKQNVGLLDPAWIRELRSLGTAFRNVQGDVSYLTKHAATSLSNLNEAVALAVGDIAQIMKVRPKQGAKAMSEAIRGAIGSVEDLMRTGIIKTGQGMREMSRLMIFFSKQGTKAAGDAMDTYAKAIRRAMDRGVITAGEGMKLLNQGFVAEAKAFSAYLSPAAQKQLVAIQDLQARGINPGGRQRGGLVQFGAPGERAKDSIPVAFGSEKIVVAPGEVGAVFTGEQQHVVNRALHAQGIPGLDGLFRAHATEHERTRRYAKGGIAAGRASPYVFPMGPGLTWGRIDMGVDFAGAGNIAAIGDATMTHVQGQNTGSGWPGAGDGGTGNRGALMAYRLNAGPKAGRYVYLAENVDPLVSAGAHLLPGQVYAHARGAFPYLETGWAADGSGRTLSAARGTQNTHPNHSNTPEGVDFAAFLRGLQRGRITGGIAGGIGLPAAPPYKPVKRIVVEGAESPLKSIVQASLDKTRATVNARLKQMSQQAATSTGVGSAAIGGSGHDRALMMSIAKQHGWSFADWWKLDAQETSHGANLANPTSTARLRGQFLNFNWGKYGIGSDPRRNPSMDDQIRSMALYIQQRYGNTSAAWAHEQAYGWYGKGGVAAGRLARLAEGSTGVARLVANDKAGVHAASSNARLQHAINAAELFWSHTRHFNGATPAHRRARIKYGSAGGYNAVTLPDPGQPGGGDMNKKYVRVDPGYASGASWTQLARTVAHEYGHMMLYHHSHAHGDPRHIMYSQNTAASVPWTGRRGEGWAAAHGWSGRGPANLGIPYPPGVTPGWFKGGGTPTPTPPPRPHPVSGYGAVWTAGEYAGLAEAHGVKGYKATVAGAIAMAETAPHGKFASVGDAGHSFGPWQVYLPAHPQYNAHKLLTDPDYTANAMAQISAHGTNWRPWTTYKTGAYKAWLGAAAKHRKWPGGHSTHPTTSGGRPGAPGSRPPRHTYTPHPSAADVALSHIRIFTPGDWWNQSVAGVHKRATLADLQLPHLTNVLDAVEADPNHTVQADIDALKAVIANREDHLKALLDEKVLADAGVGAENRQIVQDQGVFARIAQRVRDNAHELRTLTAEFTRLQRKKKLAPSERTRKNHLHDLMANLWKGQTLLTGVPTPDPTYLNRTAADHPEAPLGKAWGAINTERSRKAALAEVADQLPYDIQADRDELDLGPNSWRGRLKALTDQAGATPQTSDLTAGLLRTQLDAALANLRLSEAELRTFKGFQGQLVGGLGGFDRGTLSVPRTGYALIHEGEMILPSPEGAYGHQIRPYPGQQPGAVGGDGGPIDVHITLGGDVAGLVRVVDARIERRASRVVNVQVGRDGRQLSVAPGR